MQKSILIALVLTAGLSGAAYAKGSAQKETCKGATTRCITSAYGDVVWGYYSSDEESSTFQD